MNYISMPNLPDKPVTAVIADGTISRELEKGFLKSGLKAIKTARHPDVYEAIAFHPDIMLHHLGGNDIIYAPGTDHILLHTLSLHGFNIIEGHTLLKDRYPGTIAYNVARVGAVAFHNLKYTDPVLKMELERRDVKLIHINQGYAKCSISIVDEKSIITSDKGIANIAEKNGLDVLLIDEKENILLPGLENGFIGGATGLIGPKRWAVAGHIEHLKSAKKIVDFLEKRQIEIVSISDEQVKDIGSILPMLSIKKVCLP